jgi:hypothetical protein
MASASCPRNEADVAIIAAYVLLELNERKVVLDVPQQVGQE